MRHTISLPDAMSRFVDAQIGTGMYGNVSEYFRDLVRRDHDAKQQAAAELGRILDRAEDSGVSPRSMAEVMDTARGRVHRQDFSGG